MSRWVTGVHGMKDKIAVHSGVQRKTSRGAGFIRIIVYIKGFGTSVFTEYAIRGCQVVYGWPFGE